MAIGSVGAAPLVPPSQAMLDQFQGSSSVPAFNRPEAVRWPKADARLQPRALTLSYQRSTAIKKLLEDANGGSSDYSEQLASLTEHLRAGGKLTSLASSSNTLQSSLLYILASELVVSYKKTDTAFAKYVESEIAALFSAKGEEISAAVNSANAFSKTPIAPTDRRWLRAGYLAVVSTQGVISELLESLLLRFGPAGFKEGVLVLLRGINDDLNSSSPSVRPGRLHLLLLSSLVSLRHLSAFIHATVSFIVAHKPLVVVSNTVRSSASQEDNDARQPFDQESNASDQAIDNAGTNEEAETVRAFLQLIAGQGSIKLLQKYLEERFGQHLNPFQQEKLFKDFLVFIQQLPLALWREKSHKDKLLEALRKQLFIDQLERSTAR